MTQAGYVLLRLPLEIGDLFTEWLTANCPDRAKRVLSLMRSTRGGKLYDAKWGERMVGDGPYAWMIGRRFEVAAERLGLNKSSVELRTDLFTPPVLKGQQMRL
ncbi:MAG TPA: radical SAM protein, partial [Rhizobiales bacterium]|nr:radical SAM protein [Hyphomicrobiales bacterium]